MQITSTQQIWDFGADADTDTKVQEIFDNVVIKCYWQKYVKEPGYLAF